MSAFDLTGKIVLVAGASSGLGRESAIRLSEHGATLIITGRNEKRLKKTFEALTGVGHQYLVADLTIASEREKLADAVPKLNGVVYSVGTTSIIPTGFITEEKLSEVFKSNFESVVMLNERLTRKKKLAKGNCSVVWISTVSTQYPFIGGALYISAKAAVEGYSRVFAAEMAPKGIRSNCLRPGYVRTPLTAATEEISKNIAEKIEEKQPLGIGQPEDVANVVVFFISDAAKWITGQNLILGGG